MGYISVRDPEKIASALASGDEINIKKDGARSADLTARNSGVSGTHDSYGRMYIAEERKSVTAAVRVIYSFDTPIAWELPGGAWVCSVQHYGLRSTGHQRVTVAALDLLDGVEPRTVDGRDAVAVLNNKPALWTGPMAA